MWPSRPLSVSGCIQRPCAALPLYRILRVTSLPRTSLSHVLPVDVLPMQALDESHTIANTTGAAKVVNQLIANRRWCITGCVQSSWPTYSSNPYKTAEIFSRDFQANCAPNASAVPSGSRAVRSEAMCVSFSWIVDVVLMIAATCLLSVGLRLIDAAYVGHRELCGAQFNKPSLHGGANQARLAFGGGGVEW